MQIADYVISIRMAVRKHWNGKIKDAFDDENNLNDPELAERVEGLAASVVQAARKLKEE